MNHYRFFIKIYKTYIYNFVRDEPLKPLSRHNFLVYTNIQLNNRTSLTIIFQDGDINESRQTSRKHSREVATADDEQKKYMLLKLTNHLETEREGCKSLAAARPHIPAGVGRVMLGVKNKCL